MNQQTLNIVIATVAVLWPILLTAMDRAYGRGQMEVKLSQIERDVSELRGMFILTPVERQRTGGN